MRLQENEVDNIEGIQLYTREFNFRMAFGLTRTFWVVGA